MSDYLPVVREILREILSVAPLKGAKLKPLVVAEFERRTKESYARALWNFPRFSDLLRALEDLVEVDREGSTDIVVRLKQDQVPGREAGPIPSYLPSQPYIQGSLWHAFTNPDAERRRFYHRRTGEVIHYKNGEDDSFAAKVAGDADFVEIRPIPRPEHNGWMREFVQSYPLPTAMKSPLLSISSVPYTSQLNRAFAAALEKYAEAWRRFRTAKVIGRVRKWAEENNVALPELVRTPSERLIKDSPSSPAVTTVAVAPTPDLRRMLHAVVEELKEEDLAHVLIPASALLKLAYSK